MSKIDDGGQAFPIQLTGGPGGMLHAGEPGMTLRDWLVGQALIGLLANGQFIEPEGLFTRNGAASLAEGSYLLADAVLAHKRVAEKEEAA